jgi:ParB-like chromosome segregation protein Spo0J
MDPQILEETAKGADVDSESVALTSRSARLPLRDMELILRLRDAGKQQTEIAQIVGCSQSSVARTLAKLKETPAVTQALLKSDSLNALTDWKRSRRAAAKRGDHRPAKEWIEMAHPELRAQPGNTSGLGGVVINIGAPGKSLEPPTFDLVVSPREIKVLGEGPQE